MEEQGPFLSSVPRQVQSCSYLIEDVVSEGQWMLIIDGSDVMLYGVGVNKDFIHKIKNKDYYEDEQRFFVNQPLHRKHTL